MSKFTGDFLNVIIENGSALESKVNLLLIPVLLFTGCGAISDF